MSNKKVTGAIVGVILILASIVLIQKKNTSPIQASQKLNVVWILIDALRTDHLGCYGYEKDTSPFIDKFAHENVLFKYAFSQESYTHASVPSYLTSTYPFVHQVLYSEPTMDILDSKFITLAEVLKEENYSTAAFVFNPHLKAKFNYEQGFDVYDDDEKGFLVWFLKRLISKMVQKIFHKGKEQFLKKGESGSISWYLRNKSYETARKIFKKVKRHLKKHKSRPVFLYLHFRDVHAPYAPPSPYNELFLSSEEESNANPAEGMRFEKSQYDGGIRYTNDYIEKTLEMLGEYNISRENSIIIMTADHGEEFDDDHPDDPGGEYHGRTLYMEQIHVPLIVSIPGIHGKKRIIDSYVELIDIVPTVLDVLNIDWEKYNQFQGKSLLPLIKGIETDSRVIYSGGSRGRGVLIEKGYKYYVYDKESKENKNLASKRPSNDHQYVFIEELYNIAADPRETKNLIHEEADIALRMREKLLRLKDSFPVGAGSKSVELDEITVEQLKSLGYL